MKKQLHLNAFALATPSPQFSGMWKHPADRSAEGYRRFDYWIDLAKQIALDLVALTLNRPE